MNKKNRNINQSRRTFLKGLSLVAVTPAVVSCDRTIEKAIPLLIQPEELIPGEALHYATSLYNGLYFESVLAKVIDGRPIKIEPNTLHEQVAGTSVQAQASVLDLYDDARVKEPLVKGRASSIEVVDKIVQENLYKAQKTGKPIIIISNSIISPTIKQIIEAFKSKFDSTRHLFFDPISYSAIRKANKINFGKAIIPHYRFDKAQLIVSFQADFLNGFLNPLVYSKQYAIWKDKLLINSNLFHYQLESSLSLTGAAANKRIVIQPSEEKSVLLDLLKCLQNNNQPRFSFIGDIADKLKNAKNKSLIVSSTNDVEVQLLVNKINAWLDNFDKTIELQNESFLFQADESAFHDELLQLQKKKGGVLINLGTDLCYHVGHRPEIKNLFKNCDLSVSFSYYHDETAQSSNIVIPQNHYLESWGDYQMSAKSIYLSQPVVKKLFATQQTEDVLLHWLGDNQGYQDKIKRAFISNSELSNLSDGEQQSRWFDALQKGFYNIQRTAAINLKFTESETLKTITTNNNKAVIEVQLVPDVLWQSGLQPHNPWISELPNPITKASWGQYAGISEQLATQLGVKTGDIISIRKIEIPIIIQPGQQKNTITLPLGFGRKIANRKFNITGTNFNSFVEFNEESWCYSFISTDIVKTGKSVKIPFSQTQNYVNEKNVLNPEHDHHISKTALYPETTYSGHHWLMVVDLNKCTGCNACVISCQAENNIPVVGPDEVSKNRLMHWINIHRYFTEKSSDFEMKLMPVMCQHCDNAPCENVCPVAATNHSKEGVNQMVYNRCIGTRYCNNNCPYKVRVFNWFDYNGTDSFIGNKHDYAGMTTKLRRMVLNPDVTTRAKGVIEKCSFCFQRIQKGKNDARNQNRLLTDTDIQPACASACPSNAIIFGDRNDTHSKVYNLLQHKRVFHLLGDLNTLPSVVYLQKNQQ